MAIKVLMLGWELPPFNSGGLGTASLGLTEGLASLGTDIRFVIPKKFGDFPFDHMEIVSASDYSTPAEAEEFLNMTAAQQDLAARSIGYGNTLSIDERKRLILEGAAPLTPNMQAQWYAHQAKQIAAEGDYQIIHGHDWFTYYAGMEAKRVAKERGMDVPFVAHVHATEIDRCGVGNGDPAILEIERKGLAAADHVIAVSHYTKELVHQHYKIPRSKISVVYNGVPTHKQPQRFDIAELKKHHKIVLFMGRITYQKGPDYFVKLAKAVTDADPSVRFVMVGTGDMEKKCIEQSAALGLTGKMLFSSFLRGADVDRAYQLADLFVMPSVSEPFGIVALEAMQNGTPTLVSKQSGIAEVSDNVMKVDFWNLEAMRDAVLHTLENPEHAEAMKNGSLADLANLSWTNAAESLRAVYEKLVPQTLVPATVIAE